MVSDGNVRAMLALDDPRWSTLQHAYGPARDTPEHLRALSAAPPGRDGAIWAALASSLLHQGGLYPATYAAVPHLAALLPGAQLERQWTILDFLSPVFRRSPREEHDFRAIARDLRPFVIDVVRRAEPERVAHLVMLFVAVHAPSSRSFDLPDGAELYGACPSCGRSLELIVEGDDVLENEALDGSAMTPQRIVRASRVRNRIDEARARLADRDADWDDPFVFAAGAALAEEVHLDELRDNLVALDTVIACTRCGTEHRVVEAF